MAREPEHRDTERRDQPVVTIVDPAAPPRPTAGAAWPPPLARAREAWRRWPVGVAAAGAVATLVAGLLTAVVMERRDRAEADAARRDVALAVSLPDELGELRAGIQVRLVNLGTRPVRVLSVALPESPPAELRGARLDTGGTLDVVVPDTRRCPSGLVRVEQTAFRVRLETERGDRVTREVALAPARDATLKGFESSRCGLLSPGAAVSVVDGRARTAGGVMALAFPLVNTSRVAVALDRLGVPTGLLLEAPERVVLPAPAGTSDRAVGTARPVRLVLRLRVTDCGALAATLSSYQVWPSVTARATSELGEDVVELLLTDVGVGSAFDALTARCPGVPRYAGPGH